MDAKKFLELSRGVRAQTECADDAIKRGDSKDAEGFLETAAWYLAELRKENQKFR